GNIGFFGFHRCHLGFHGNLLRYLTQLQFNVRSHGGADLQLHLSLGEGLESLRFDADGVSSWEKVGDEIQSRSIGAAHCRYVSEHCRRRDGGVRDGGAGRIRYIPRYGSRHRLTKSRWYRTENHRSYYQKERYYR